jgi:hypothetical protein
MRLHHEEWRQDYGEDDSENIGRNMQKAIGILSKPSTAFYIGLFLEKAPNFDATQKG